MCMTSRDEERAASSKKNVKNGSNKKKDPVDEVDLSELTDDPKIMKFKQSEWNVAVSFFYCDLSYLV